MSDIKLGVSGSQTTLPKICWQAGSAPGMPYNVDKGVEEIRMLDGSTRFNFTQHQAGSFTLEWDGLIYSQVSSLLAVVALNEQLVYTNEYIYVPGSKYGSFKYGDGTHYGLGDGNHNVVVTDFGYSLKAGTVTSTAKYTFSITLKEVA